MPALYRAPPFAEMFSPGVTPGSTVIALLPSNMVSLIVFIVAP